jgi:hypothetical protein
VGGDRGHQLTINRRRKDQSMLSRRLTKAMAIGATAIAIGGGAN